MVKGRNRMPPTTTTSRLFYGVAVKPNDRCKCAAVAAIDGVRFLSDEAPSLPLPDCEIPRACKCAYRHFEDRRTAKRRDADYGLPPGTHTVERRTRPARRITDA